MRKLINFIFIISIFLIILTGCSQESKESTLEDKVTEEIKYMEDLLIGIVRKFALAEYENTDKILEDTRKLEEASNRIMVDLAAGNVENSEINKLSDGINKMITLASSEDNRQYLVELNNVFSLFPNFEAKISKDDDEIFERRLKYFAVSSYIAYEVGDKELAKKQANALESEFSGKQKDVEYVESHKFNLNKIYLLIEELKKGIETDSEVLVKEKYLLLIDEI